MKCNCTFAQKLVGDGCEICNPKLATEIDRENFEEDAKQYGFDLTRRECAAPEPWSEYADIATGHRWEDGWPLWRLFERHRAMQGRAVYRASCSSGMGAVVASPSCVDLGSMYNGLTGKGPGF